MLPPVNLEFDGSTLEKEASTGGLYHFFQNKWTANLPSMLWRHCVKMITECKFVDDQGRDFSHPHVRIGNRGENFGIFAKTNVYSGYSVELFLECTNSITQTINNYPGRPFVVTQDPSPEYIEPTGCTGIIVPKDPKYGDAVDDLGVAAHFFTSETSSKHKINPNGV